VRARGVARQHYPACAVIGLFLCVSLPSSSRAQLKRFEYSADAMGGAFSLVLYGADRPTADAAAAAAFSELSRLERMLSNYRPESEWSRVNRQASGQAVEVSPEMFDLLSACFEYSRKSEGAFDITVGPLMKAWEYREGKGRLPEEAAIRGAMDSVGYRKLLLDPANRTIRFARAGVEIDPGGIGKGYAVDRIIEVLKRSGIERALVSAAGSSIYALGAPPGEEGWRVGIRSPGKAEGDAGPILLRDASISTSGNSEKYFRAGGKRYGHIFDPRTGHPTRGVLLVSVAAPRTIDSEAWTKAFFVNGRQWSEGHIPPGFRVFFCDEQAGHPVCVWLAGENR
jgi:thiamine biosynthesis lipoprotein